MVRERSKLEYKTEDDWLKKAIYRELCKKL